MSCSRTQRSASGEARTCNPSISGQALYHDCAPQLGSILCRYDTCPTQYAPDLRGSILCMQGTQYAPRESILCMEHFVALQTSCKGLAPINEVKRINIVHSVTKNVLNMANSASSADPSCSVFCLFALLLYVPVNSYGHYGMVSSSNHTCSWVNLIKLLTSTSCT